MYEMCNFYRNLELQRERTDWAPVNWDFLFIQTVQNSREDQRTVVTDGLSSNEANVELKLIVK